MTGTVEAENRMTIGGLMPGGQRGANRVGGGGDLGECEVDADIRLEVNPRHGDALQRLALHVADAIDVITESERGIGG